MSPLVDLARDWLMDVRRNHALEHATVSVLFAHRGPQRLAGRAKSDGFYIIGRIEPELLRSCADEALLRLQRGEAGLAVSPMCGTNLAVTGALCSLATIGSLARTRGSKRRDRLGDAVSLSMVAAVVAQPAGRLLQEKITTLADHGQVEVTGVREYFPGFMKVSTRRHR